MYYSTTGFPAQIPQPQQQGGYSYAPGYAQGGVGVGVAAPVGAGFAGAYYYPPSGTANNAAPGSNYTDQVLRAYLNPRPAAPPVAAPPAPALGYYGQQGPYAAPQGYGYGGYGGFPQQPQQQQQQINTRGVAAGPQYSGFAAGGYGASSQWDGVIDGEDGQEYPGNVVPVGARTRTKALVVGINYYGQKGMELDGCVDDARRVAQALTARGYKVQLLVDDPRSRTPQPTRQNILKAMQWLVSGAKKGDALFFSYAGHGHQQRDTSGDEADSLDETLLPVDWRSKGEIVDDQIFKLLVRPLPAGVKLHALLDCCHSGTGLDLPFSVLPDVHPQVAAAVQSRKVTKNASRRRGKLYRLAGDVIAYSGARDNQLSEERVNERAGAMTHAFIQALSQGQGRSYWDLLQSINAQLRAENHRQTPQLSCSKPFDLSSVVDI